jgi:DNA polymerase III delta subunit
MKLNFDAILLNIENQKLDNRIFLISGNEETLIFAIQEALVDFFKKKGYLETVKTEGAKIDKHDESANEKSLFSSKKIIIHKNPKTLDLNYISSISDESIITIINDKNLKNSSKQKKDFDKSKKSYSINCYQITRPFKQKYLDKYCREKKINISTEGYWFLIDSSPNQFALFKNELDKIVNFGEKNLSLNNIRLLLTNDNRDADLDALFFLATANRALIITKTNDIIRSSSDAYMLIQRIKFYLDLLCKIKNESEIEIFFPKYLFMYKENFAKIKKKTDMKKIFKIMNLVSMAEIMIRKNNNFYFIIVQRFLLNIGNAIK